MDSKIKTTMAALLQRVAINHLPQCMFLGAF